MSKSHRPITGHSRWPLRESGCLGLWPENKRGFCRALGILGKTQVLQRWAGHHLPKHSPVLSSLPLCSHEARPAGAWLPEGILRCPWQPPSPGPQAPIEAVSFPDELVTPLPGFLPVCAGLPNLCEPTAGQASGLFSVIRGLHAHGMPHPENPLPLPWNGRNKCARIWDHHIIHLGDRTDSLLGLLPALGF